MLNLSRKTVTPCFVQSYETVTCDDPLESGHPARGTRPGPEPPQPLLPHVRSKEGYTEMLAPTARERSSLLIPGEYSGGEDGGDGGGRVRACGHVYTEGSTVSIRTSEHVRPQGTRGRNVDSDHT